MFYFCSVYSDSTAWVYMYKRACMYVVLVCVRILCGVQVFLHPCCPCPLRLEGMQEHQIWWRHVPNYW